MRRIARRTTTTLALATAMTGLVLTSAASASAGTYVCYSYTPINYPSGQPITYYPTPDGVQKERCEGQAGGGGEIELPL